VADVTLKQLSANFPQG